MFIAVNCVVFGFVLYRINNMGLLPLSPADWISYLPTNIDEKLVVINK